MAYFCFSFLASLKNLCRFKNGECRFTVSLGLPPQVLVPAPRVIRRDLQSGEIMVEMCKSKSKNGMIECFVTLNVSASTLVFAKWGEPNGMIVCLQDYG